MIADALLLVTMVSGIGTFALLGAELADEGLIEPIAGLDGLVAAALHAHTSDGATAVMAAVTQLGGTAVLVPLAASAALALLLSGRTHHALLLASALVGSQALTALLKLTFRRDRPSFPDPIATATNFSFPSGHAAVSLAVYGALAFVVAARLSSQRARLCCSGGAALLALVIGFSRLYLGVHYLSDVVVGLGLGLGWLLLCVSLLGRLERRQAAQVDALDPADLDDHEQHAAAASAPRNGARRAHVDLHLRKLPAREAMSALAGRSRHLGVEHLEKETADRVSVEGFHHRPPVAPNRSVFTRAAG